MLLEKVRKALLLPSRSQWSQWSLPSKQTTVGAIVGVLALLLTLYTLLPSAPQKPPIKAYDLDQSRRESFLELLQVGQHGPRDRLRIGCVQWSEASCVAAGKFLTLFSEAGWEMESDYVYKVEPGIPTDGMTITTRSDDIAKLPKLPPHQGRWSAMDRSQALIVMAFKYMDNPVHASRDPTLPPDTLGIYFGPEPPLVQSIKPEEKATRRELINYIGSGMAIEQRCSQNQLNGCAGMLIPWESDVASYLREHGFSKAAVEHWNSLPGIYPSFTTENMEKRLNLLISIVLGIE